MEYTIESLHSLHSGEWHTYFIKFSDRQDAITWADIIYLSQFVLDVRVIDMMNGEIIYGYFTRTTKKE